MKFEIDSRIVVKESSNVPINLWGMRGIVKSFNAKDLVYKVILGDIIALIDEENLEKEKAKG